MWFNRAATHASDTEGSDRAVKNRDSIAMHMTMAQIAEAQRLAQKWTESHAS
jgi:hypothetical protein